MIYLVGNVIHLSNNLDQGPVSRRAWKVFTPGSHSKIKSNLLITELFYSHILSMKRSSIHTRSFRSTHLSVFRFRWTKNGFTGPKSFWGFQEIGPRLLNLESGTHQLHVHVGFMHSLQLWSWFIIFLEKFTSVWYKFTCFVDMWRSGWSETNHLIA